jgi:preprotein translocase subunit SecD
MINIPRWQSILILGIVLLGVAFTAPNFVSQKTLDSLPDWLPNKQINLGLDLRGGSYLLLEVEMDAVVEEQLENLVDAIRLELRGNRINYTNLGIQNGQVVFGLRDSSKAD